MRYLLFDLDGTLIDPYPGISASILYALEALDHPHPGEAALRECIGPPLSDGFARLLNDDEPGRIARAVGLYRERYAERGLFEAALYPGIVDALARLSADPGREALYVATSKPVVYAERIIAHFGLERFFRRVYGSELDGTRSRKADLIAHILAREALDADAVCMIGDRHHDIDGARHNDVDTVGVLWGYGAPGELARAGAGRLCRTPAGLAQMFTAP